eukprot:686459-Prymnesium_polylepis.1
MKLSRASRGRGAWHGLRQAGGRRRLRGRDAARSFPRRLQLTPDGSGCLWSRADAGVLIAVVVDV